MARKIDQTHSTRKAGICCLCIDCPEKEKCSFANSLWAAKSRSVKYGKFHPSFITIKCDRRENKLEKPVYSMTDLYLFFDKYDIEHLCDDCPEKSSCDFCYSAKAGHDAAESQNFNPWHIVYKCAESSDRSDEKEEK